MGEVPCIKRGRPEKRVAKEGRDEPGGKRASCGEGTVGEISGIARNGAGERSAKEAEHQSGIESKNGRCGQGVVGEIPEGKGYVERWNKAVNA